MKNKIVTHYYNDLGVHQFLACIAGAQRQVCHEGAGIPPLLDAGTIRQKSKGRTKCSIFVTHVISMPFMAFEIGASFSWFQWMETRFDTNNES